MFPSILGFLALFLHSQVRQAHANNAQILVTTSLVNFDARIVQAWSRGGGDIWTIGNDSNHPFTGREFGAANRSTLKGTQTFGSGYPYGNVDSTKIAGRPFPYGLWPLYWGNNITGSDEYGPTLDGVRPGGQLVTIPLKTEDATYNITGGELYHIIGDRDSATFMMISLVTSCHVSPAWPIKFDPTASNSTVKMENVIQYYRASSFALALLGYNNSFARWSTNTESTENTPIPDTIRYSEFHKCLDDVIVDALAIMNGGPVPGGTMAIVLGVLGGLIPVFHVAVIAVTLSTIRQRKATLAIRTEALNYERFP